IDECHISVQCDEHARCTNISGSSKCICEDDYTGDGYTCRSIELPCNLNCYLNPECVTVNDDEYYCQCSDGYSTDVNECEMGIDYCDGNLATCTNTPGSYTCSCISGYTGSGRIGECHLIPCQIGCASQPNCAQLGNNSIESHRSKQKYFCCLRFMYHFFYAYSDINECNIGIDNCDEHAICINTPGSYHCSCTFGYTGSGIVGYCKGMI
ncbi:hypothetical protein LSH36_872g02000, partial [Paralvinella palmiformis]